MFETRLSGSVELSEPRHVTKDGSKAKMRHIDATVDKVRRSNEKSCEFHSSKSKEDAAADVNANTRDAVHVDCSRDVLFPKP